MSSRPFYTSQVRFPMASTPIAAAIEGSPRFRFFCDCIGTVDGTHIHAFVRQEDHPCMQNCKGFLLKNCLFICNFDFFFTYALTGWDGSMADAALWETACTTKLCIPEGKYIFGDAGFGLSKTTLVPYHGVCYHLKEWHQARSQ